MTPGLDGENFKFIFLVKKPPWSSANFYYSLLILFQVKEACRKASEAELTAKDRLQQMNYELNIHCRITVFHLQVEVFYFQL